MTVDITRLEHNAVAVLGTTTEATNVAMEKLAQWVEAARNANQLVAPLIDTAFIPDAYKPKVDPRATPDQRRAAYNVAVANATAAVLQGISLGVDPLVALQQIFIIHGRPGMYAEFMVALVQSHGHDVWTEDLTDTRAVVCGRRKGKEYIERVTITMDMARRAQWTKNAKYQETPQDMLYARAAARVCRRIAPDVLKGIAAVEEVQDTIQAAAEVGNGQRVVKPRHKAAALPAAPTPEPPLEAEPEPEVDAELDAEPAVAESAPEPLTQQAITASQLKMLHALMGKAGYGDRDDGLAYLSAQVGRDITSSKELSKAEASRIIDGLAIPEEPPLDELWPETPAVPS